MHPANLCSLSDKIDVIDWLRMMINTQMLEQLVLTVKARWAEDHHILDNLNVEDWGGLSGGELQTSE